MLKVSKFSFLKKSVLNLKSVLFSIKNFICHEMKNISHERMLNNLDEEDEDEEQDEQITQDEQDEQIMQDEQIIQDEQIMHDDQDEITWTIKKVFEMEKKN